MTWLRSGNENNYNNANVLSTSGVYNNNNVTASNGVRPALHSLTKWCKFSRIWQIAGKKLLRFANWRYEDEGTYYPAFSFFQKAKQTRPFCNGFLLWNELEKAVELFFIFPAKKLFCGDPIILWSDLIMTIFCHSERNAVQSKNLGLLLVY